MSARRAAPQARGGRRSRRVLEGLASVALAATLLVVILPRVTGTHWRDVGSAFSQLSVAEFLMLFLVWQLGLAAYSFVLAASLPGMSRPQGYVMNFVSSAVANLVPFGGAAGVGVMWWMARGWGFANSAFGLFTLVTFVANIVAKAVVPGIALVALVLESGRQVPRLVLDAATGGAVLCIVVVATLVLLLSSDRAAESAARVAGSVGRRLQALRHSEREVDWRTGVLDLREQTSLLLRHRWPTLVAGMLAYQALQAVLMWLCLWVVHGPTAWAPVLCAFAFGRLLTSVVLTPGGTGFAETGAAAVLVALGGAPGPSVAGVLLFSVFTYLLEIPGGVVCLGVHLLKKGWRRPLASSATAAVTPLAEPPAPSHRTARAP